MNLSNLPFIIIGYLILTIILEIILSIVLGLKKKDLIYVVLVNILTNPLLNALNTYFTITYKNIGYILSLIILEILAFFIEGLIYKKVLSYKKIKPLILSFILNLFSFSIGYIINISI